MEHNKLVSVILTTHNRPPEIVLRAVNSVLNQTYSNIEFIVVDDSSSDYTHRKEVEKEVRKASERIIYITLETNRGACAARNTGLSYAHGYYVAFLDDDDEWFPEKIEEQIKGFKNDNTALVYSTYRIINKITNQEYYRFKKQAQGEITFNKLLRRNVIGTTSNPLIKKECVDEVGGFDEELQSSQDYDLWLRIVERYPVAFIDKPLLNYYIHEGQRISTDVDSKIAGFEYLNLKYHEYLEKDNLVWYMSHRCLLWFYLKKYGRSRAVPLWVQCVKKAPWLIIRNMKDFLMIVLGADNYSLFVRIIKKPCRKVVENDR